MKRLLFILLLTSCCYYAWGQQVVSGRVVDAETGEALPYVSVYAGENRGTVTNTDGDFRIRASQEEVLQFSYVGYEKKKLAISGIPRIIRLKPYTKSLNEVTVQANGTDIVEKVIKRLELDYKVFRREKKLYFYRTMLEREDEALLIELLIKAYSAVNIRELSIASGAMDLYGEHAKPIPLSLSNIHRHAEIGPKTYKSEFWSYPIKPLDNIVTTRKYYQQDMETIQGADGKRLFRITFNWKNVPMKASEKDRRYLTGTMTVDADNYRILNFDGIVNNANQWVNNLRMPSQISFHIDYDYGHGYASVSNVTIEGGNKDMHYKTMMFCVDDADHLAKIKAPAGSDIVTKIADAGYDSTLWNKYDLVKRTDAEESASQGVSMLNQDLSAHKTDTADSLAADPRLRDLYQQIVISSRSHPQEKVYVHMDNTCYFQGDTIWYAAYLHNTGTASPSTTSGLLYVELFSPDGYLIERQNVMMRDGCGHGNFVLDERALYGGFYELRAYTSWQLNWGERQQGKLPPDYDKIYSRVFPVYDRPLSPGDYTYDMTARPLRRHFSKDPDNPVPQLTLYPEGGHLIEGKEGRVAFEARWSDGREMSGTLTVGSDTISTVHRGRGTFNIVPTTENTIATFVATDGTRVQTRLPQPVKNGATLCVRQQDDNWTISTQRAGNALVQPLGLTIMQDGRLEIFRPLADSVSVFTFPDSILQSGVNQATIYDTEGRILADRIFFVQHQEKNAPVSITGAESTFAPMQKIRLNICTSGVSPAGIGKRNTISLSVRDASQMPPSYDSGDIRTEMLLASEIKGFVPQPQWYFEQDDALHRQALDLLMMTQGWRRFSWHEMATQTAWQTKHPKEKTKALHGIVYQYDVDFNPNMNDDAEENKKDTVERLALEELEESQERFVRHTIRGRKPTQTVYVRAIAIRTDIKNPEPQGALIKVEDGRFSIDFPQLQGTGTLFLDLEPEYKEKPLPDNLGIRMDNPYPAFVQPYSYYQNHLPAHTGNTWETPAAGEDSTTILQELQVQKTLHGLRAFNDATPALLLGSVEAENMILDTGSGAGRPFDHAQLINALYGHLGPEFSADISMRHGITPLRRSLEGMEDIPTDSIYSPRYLKSYSTSFPFSPGELREIEEAGIERYAIYTDYCPRLRGSKRYQGGNKPEIVVVAYPYADGLKHELPSLRCLPIPSYSYADSFYSPDYSKQALPEGQEDYRRTLYWNPNLQLDENGEATVTFYNNSRTTHLSIEAEGQAADGTLLWGREE